MLRCRVDEKLANCWLLEEVMTDKEVRFASVIEC